MQKNLILMFTISLFAIITLSAQEKESKLDFSLGSDIMNRYVWRGTQFSTGPSIQPGFELSAGNFAFGAWGAYSFNGLDGAETDLYLSYTFMKDMFTATFTDYFFPNELIAKNKYFNYDKDVTGHVFEGSLSFNGTEKLPLSLLFAANFYGADAMKVIDDVNSTDFNQTDGIQYSMYLELGYSLQLKETNLDLFAGFTPNNPKKADATTGYIGENGFYGETMGFVNIGLTASKEIQISEKFSLPIQTSLITNPMSENIFIVFGFSL